MLPDRKGTEDDYIRVIDESGEDYLYPAGYFIPIKLTTKLKRALGAAI